MIGKTIDQLRVGESAQYSKTITDADIDLFAGITGDLNPAHIKERKILGTAPSKRRVVTKKNQRA